MYVFKSALDLGYILTYFIYRPIGNSNKNFFVIKPLGLQVGLIDKIEEGLKNNSRPIIYSMTINVT